MDEQSVARAASTIGDLWARSAQIPDLPLDIRPATLDEGWAVQRALDARLGPIGGWKLAATSPTGQAMIGVDAPLLGALYASTLLADGATVVPTWMGVVEAEFAFRIRGDLPIRATPFTRHDLLPHIDAALAGLEVPESRLSSYPKTGGPQMVADGMCAAWYVVGSPLPMALADLPATELVIHRNGVAGDRKHGTDILGDPVEALVLLANSLAVKGQHLRDGDIVTTGGCAVITEVVDGDVITATYDGVESVRLTVSSVPS